MDANISGFTVWYICNPIWPDAGDEPISTHDIILQLHVELGQMLTVHEQEAEIKHLKHTANTVESQLLSCL